MKQNSYNVAKEAHLKRDLDIIFNNRKGKHNKIFFNIATGEVCQSNNKNQSGKKKSKGIKERFSFQRCVIKNLGACLMVHW